MYRSRRATHVVIAVIFAVVGVVAIGQLRGSSDSSRAAPAQEVVVVEDGHVTIVDERTGAIVHRFDSTLRSQSAFVEIHRESEKLFISDLVWDGEDNVDHVRIYNTSDWSLEQEIEVPDIIRYLGDHSGLAPSADGSTLYVYNYNDRTRGTGPVKYWLSVFDLDANAWLEQEIELPGCGVSRLAPIEGTQLDVHCYDSGSVWSIDVNEGSSGQLSVDVVENEQHTGGP